MDLLVAYHGSAFIGISQSRYHPPPATSSQSHFSTGTFEDITLYLK